MKKCLLLLLCFPVIVLGQINVGNDQIICYGGIANVIGLTSVQSSTESYQVTNITFDPEVISGTSIPLTDDAVSNPLSIGFTFQFYGNNYTDFYVGSNGWVGFSSGQPTSYFATAIPDSNNVPKDCIMLSWEDLNPGTGGQVLYQTIGSAPNRKLVLTFDAVPYFGSTTIAGPVTSQVILHITTATFYQTFGFGSTLYDFTIMFPLVIGALTAIPVFALIRVLGGTTSGLFAALDFMISSQIGIEAKVLYENENKKESLPSDTIYQLLVKYHWKKIHW